jgi:hypothetical protein
MYFYSASIEPRRVHFAPLVPEIHPHASRVCQHFRSTLATTKHLLPNPCSSLRAAYHRTGILFVLLFYPRYAASVASLAEMCSLSPSAHAHHAATPLCTLSPRSHPPALSNCAIFLPRSAGGLSAPFCRLLCIVFLLFFVVDRRTSCPQTFLLTSHQIPAALAPPPCNFVDNMYIYSQARFGERRSSVSGGILLFVRCSPT